MTGFVDSYWNAFLERSTSTGNKLFSFNKAKVLEWKSARLDTKRWSWITMSCTCLLSNSSSLTKTSERKRAKRARASWRHLNIKLKLKGGKKIRNMLGVFRVMEVPTDIHNFPFRLCTTVLAGLRSCIPRRPFLSLSGSRKDIQIWCPHIFL